MDYNIINFEWLSILYCKNFFLIVYKYIRDKIIKYAVLEFFYIISNYQKIRTKINK